MEYLIDDFEVAKSYVSKMPSHLKKLRFNKYVSGGIPSGWKPSHVVMALKNGEPIAMADSVSSEVGSISEISIVANKGYGAYSIFSLLKLKNSFPADHWISCLSNPTDDLAKISKKYVDKSYDKVSDEISQELVKTHGVQHYFQPSPLFPSRSTLKFYNIPEISMLDVQSRNQLYYFAKNPQSCKVIAPSGEQISPPDLFSIVFELLNIPFTVRQSFSRFMLISMAVMHRHNVNNRFVRLHSKPSNLKNFISATQKFEVNYSTLDEGIFSLSSLG